jgi:hypothetical protein
VAHARRSREYRHARRGQRRRWVPIVLHHVCEGCDPEGYSTSPSVFSAFLAWLAPRSSTGTYVRTMRDVASDTTAPVSSIACNGSACASTAYTAPVDVSLSATDAGSGVDVIRYTVDGSDPTASSPPTAARSPSRRRLRSTTAPGTLPATSRRRRPSGSRWTRSRRRSLLRHRRTELP